MIKGRVINLNIALIFAGGVGTRMNSKAIPKQFLELNGKPILIHTIEKFENNENIDEIVVACHKDWIEYFKGLIKKFNLTKVHWVVQGGKTNQESRINGLQIIYEEIYLKKNKNIIVLLHDGVRPLINDEIINENINSVKEFNSAITCTDAIETIVLEDDKQEIKDIIAREKCKLARAPQSFWFEDIYKMHKKAALEGKEYIDCASMMTASGWNLHLVEGPIENIKITTPMDYYLFRAICEAKENSQIWGL